MIRKQRYRNNCIIIIIIIIIVVVVIGIARWQAGLSEWDQHVEARSWGLNISGPRKTIETCW